MNFAENPNLESGSCMNYLTINTANLARDFPGLYLDPMLHCPESRHKARAHADLRVDVSEMELYSFFRKAEFTGDCFITTSRNDQLKDVHFSRREVS